MPFSIRLTNKETNKKNCAHSAKIAIKLLYLYIIMAVLIGATLRNILDKMYQES